MECIKDFDSILTKICEVECLKSVSFHNMSDSRIVDWINKKSDGVKTVSGSEKVIRLSRRRMLLYQFRQFRLISLVKYFHICSNVNIFSSLKDKSDVDSPLQE
jgi:hypothetical protein